MDICPAMRIASDLPSPGRGRRSSRDRHRTPTRSIAFGFTFDSVILVVHPDPSTRGALAEALRSGGHPTGTAASADEALGILAERVDGVL